MIDRLTAAWDGLEDHERVQWTAVAGTVALFCVHYVLWSPWLIEDAAISYTYALHAATGEGWVTWPGGERVEGFSNPSWTALLAALRAVGISPWIAAPWLGLIFGVLTLPLAFLWAREVTGSRGLFPAVAPLWLALSPQYTVWVASGLENPLWVWLMAVGSLAFLRELRTGGFPWSAVPMGLLAITRPEGPLYVAAMAFVGAGLVLPRKPRALGRIVGFVALAAGIWATYEAYRFAVFAWPLPNTYYAKLEVGEERFLPWLWTTPNGGAGWFYLRSWALWSTWGFLIPIFPVAATGLAGWRGQVGLATSAILAMLLIPGAEWLTTQPFWPLEAEPPILVKIRVLLLFATVFALPWIGRHRPGAEARILAWTLAGTMFGFSLYVGADWMAGHRWINHGVVPLSVMLADAVFNLSGARAWADPRRAKLVIFGAVAGLPLVAGVVQSIALLNPTETTPFDVGRRVAYLNTVQERLHLDHPLNYDIDMGATMWWSGDRIIDIAGLVDVPTAHHSWDPPFIREYILRENRPHFLHSHGFWRTKSGLGAQPVFGRDWVRISDFVAGPGMMHVGNHVRKDLFIRNRWTRDPDAVSFAGRLRLEGLHTPAPVVMPGGILYLEVGWRTLRDQVPPFRAVAVLSKGDEVHSWELPPGYDWVHPPAWRRSEVVHGFHSLGLPAELDPGSWDLGLVVFDRVGGVWSADRAVADPVLARGEIRWRGRIEVAPGDRVVAAASEEVAELESLAVENHCTRAEEAMERARRHLAPDHPSQPWSRADLHTTLARCWARRATELDGQGAESAISRARQWDHRDREVRRIGRELADAWQAEGDAAWARDEVGAAYGAWRRTLAADPSRAHVRKRAEEARDIRLGLKDR